MQAHQVLVVSGRSEMRRCRYGLSTTGDLLPYMSRSRRSIRVRMARLGIGRNETKTMAKLRHPTRTHPLRDYHLD
jgi:hypothetical protein